MEIYCAILMGLHDRVGKDSPVQILSQYELHDIFVLCKYNVECYTHFSIGYTNLHTSQLFNDQLKNAFSDNAYIQANCGKYIVRDIYGKHIDMFDGPIDELFVVDIQNNYSHENPMFKYTRSCDGMIMFRGYHQSENDIENIANNMSILLLVRKINADFTDENKFDKYTRTNTILF